MQKPPIGAQIPQLGLQQNSPEPQVFPPQGSANRTSAIATDRDGIVAVADVAITTTGPASVVAGNTLVYTISVTNTGPSDAADVEVTDGTPTGLVFVSTTGDCTTSFPCALGVVPAGEIRTIVATYTVPPGYSGPSRPAIPRTTGELPAGSSDSSTER